jgi:hypothetical protein
MEFCMFKRIANCSYQSAMVSKGSPDLSIGCGICWIRLLKCVFDTEIYALDKWDREIISSGNLLNCIPFVLLLWWEKWESRHAMEKKSISCHCMFNGTVRKKMDCCICSRWFSVKCVALNATISRFSNTRWEHKFWGERRQVFPKYVYVLILVSFWRDSDLCCVKIQKLLHTSTAVRFYWLGLIFFGGGGSKHRVSIVV